MTGLASGNGFPFGLDEVTNSAIKRMVVVDGIVAWLEIGGNLSSLASSNGFPLSLDSGSIEVVSSTAVVVAWLRVR